MSNQSVFEENNITIYRERIVFGDKQLEMWLSKGEHESLIQTDYFKQYSPQLKLDTDIVPGRMLIIDKPSHSRTKDKGIGFGGMPRGLLFLSKTLVADGLRIKKGL